MWVPCHSLHRGKGRAFPPYGSKNDASVLTSPRSSAMTLSCTYQFYLCSLTHLDISAVSTGSAKNFQMMITQIASKASIQKDGRRIQHLDATIIMANIWPVSVHTCMCIQSNSFLKSLVASIDITSKRLAWNGKKAGVHQSSQDCKPRGLGAEKYGIMATIVSDSITAAALRFSRPKKGSYIWRN